MSFIHQGETFESTILPLFKGQVFRIEREKTASKSMETFLDLVMNFRGRPSICFTMNAVGVVMRDTQGNRLNLGCSDLYYFGITPNKLYAVELSEVSLQKAKVGILPF